MSAVELAKAGALVCAIGLILEATKAVFGLWPAFAVAVAALAAIAALEGDA